MGQGIHFRGQNRHWSMPPPPSEWFIMQISVKKKNFTNPTNLKKKISDFHENATISHC